jgi:ribosomal protein S18 acetylase RimI-like enzyme
MVEVTRTFLEMRDPAQLKRKHLPEGRDARFILCRPCSVAHYRELYRRVGERWHWTDRNAWTDERIAADIDRAEVSVWELRVDTQLAGFFQLEKQPGPVVEIVYFGLTPEFIGQGFGGAMLSKAVDEAWALGTEAVWLHTCTLDSRMALPNYEARGFVRTGKTETYVQQIAG